MIDSIDLLQLLLCNNMINMIDLPRLLLLPEQVKKLEAENATLRADLLSAANRIAEQSALLSKLAEKTPL